VPLPCQTKRAKIILGFVAYPCSNRLVKTARADYGEFLMPLCMRYPNLISLRLPVEMFVLVLMISVFQSACGLGGGSGASSPPPPIITSVSDRVAALANRVGKPATGSDFSDERGREAAKCRRYGSKTGQFGSIGFSG